MAFLRFPFLCCCIAFPLLSASPSRAEILEDFGVVVGGNYSASSEVWGGALVRGGASGSGTIGSRLDPKGDYAQSIALGVGGELSGGPFNMAAGSVHLSGSRGSVGINLNGGPGTQVVENSASVLPLANAAVSQLTSASSDFWGMVANSDVNISGTTVTFNPTFNSDGVAVFSVDSDLLRLPNANYMLDLTGMPEGATYLFNVLDDVVGASPLGNFSSSFENVSSNILWNFHAQESRLTIDRQWYGSILVPNASVINNSAIIGAAYVGGDFTQRADVRSTGFQGFAPAAVPEPSSLALLSLLGVAYAGRRLHHRRMKSVTP